MNQRGIISSAFAVVVTLIIAAGVGGYVYVQSKMPNDVETIPAPLPGQSSSPTPSQPAPPQEVACTMEAKQCPDGSYIGRTGPNCEFAACPEAVPNKWHSKEACEAATQKVCDFEMCDYLCPEGFENGWVATQKDL